MWDMRGDAAAGIAAIYMSHPDPQRRQRSPIKADRALLVADRVRGTGCPYGRRESPVLIWPSVNLVPTQRIVQLISDQPVLHGPQALNRLSGSVRDHRFMYGSGAPENIASLARRCCSSVRARLGVGVPPSALVISGHSRS
jgi:hypothetical protein